MGMMSFTLRILFWSVNKYLYQDRQESHEWWAWVNNNTATSTQMLLSLQSGAHNLKTYFSCKLIPFWSLSTPSLPCTFLMVQHLYVLTPTDVERRAEGHTQPFPPRALCVNSATPNDWRILRVKTLEGWRMGSFPSCSSKVNACCFQGSGCPSWL